MTKADKLLARMRQNLDHSGHRAALQRIGLAVFAAYGRRSHWKITAANEEAILTTPAKRPIKPVYVRKLLAMMGRRGDGEAD